MPYHSAHHIIITVLIHITSIALHKWSRPAGPWSELRQPAGVQVLSSSNKGAGARTCTAAGLLFWQGLGMNSASLTVANAIGSALLLHCLLYFSTFRLVPN